MTILFCDKMFQNNPRVATEKKVSLDDHLVQVVGSATNNLFLYFPGVTIANTIKIQNEGNRLCLSNKNPQIEKWRGEKKP